MNSKINDCLYRISIFYVKITLILWKSLFISYDTDKMLKRILSGFIEKILSVFRIQ